jgi:hypothetical protein
LDITVAYFYDLQQKIWIVTLKNKDQLQNVRAKIFLAKHLGGRAEEFQKNSQFYSHISLEKTQA